jgi:hypothetical protein
MDVNLGTSSLKTWEFWRPRVARLVLFAGLAFVGLRFAPALPKDQPIEFRAPEGSRITELELSWRTPGDVVAGRTTLHPAEPDGRMRHTLSLPNGAYELEVRAVLEGPCTGAPTEGAHSAPCPTQVFDQSRKVQLDEHTLRFDLTP